MLSTYETVDWYELPRYYDIAFASLNRAEVKFLSALCTRYAPSKQRRMLEPACGSGRLIEGLARLGHRVDGFDLGQSMIDYAQNRMRRNALPSRLWVDDMASFSTPHRYDMAFCLVNSFKYLLREEQALGHLQSVAKALKTGGIYALGFHLTEYDDQTNDVEDWQGARGRVRVTCRIDSWPPNRRTRRERLRARLLVHKPTATTATESEWQFRTYDVPQFQRLLRKVPDLEHIATHNFDYNPEEEIEFGAEDLDNIVILRKR